MIKLILAAIMGGILLALNMAPVLPATAASAPVTASMPVAASVAAATKKNITIFVDGNPVASDVAPYIDSSNRTMVPVRFVAEALGSMVDWEQKTGKVTINRRAASVCLWVGKASYRLNNDNRSMDTVPVVLPPGRTMVPVRFVAEALGARVEWDEKAYIVKITMDNGYVLPEQTDMQVDIPRPEFNPNKVDIELLLLMYKDMETQRRQLYEILKSKFGPDPAREITDYVNMKQEEFDYLLEMTWTYNNQRIRVGSHIGEHWIQLVVYLPGV